MQMPSLKTSFIIASKIFVGLIGAVDIIFAMPYASIPAFLSVSYGSECLVPKTYDECHAGVSDDVHWLSILSRDD